MTDPTLADARPADADHSEDAQILRADLDASMVPDPETAASYMARAGLPAGQVNPPRRRTSAPTVSPSSAPKAAAMPDASPVANAVPITRSEP